MTAGFDEWALARTPALLAFGAALVDDHEVVDEAVTRTLSRMQESWWKSSRDDPDVEARRRIVRLCSTPRRAAVVLRVLEHRSDSEIAHLLGCSESAVRRHVSRALAEDRPAASSAVSTTGLRDDLAARVGAAPTQLLTRPAPATVRPSRRNRRGPWATAVAVLALVAGTAYVSHESRKEAFSYPRTPVPSSWRYESYDGVQVQVPGDWGWGASPVRAAYFRAPTHLGACGTSGPAVAPVDGVATQASATVAFVGRPAIITERCMSWGSDGAIPTGDAVWFDSPFAVGQKPLGPIVAETREVGGQRVTAFSAQPALRRQILATATQVDVDAQGCPTRPVAAPAPGPSGPHPSSLSVCVYSQDTGVSTLLYSTRVAAGPAQAYAEQVAAATPARGSSCGTPHGRWVALGLHGSAATRWDLVDIACGAVRTGSGRTLGLTPDLVRAWATGGIPAYVSPPLGADAAVRQLLRAPTL